MEGRSVCWQEALTADVQEDLDAASHESSSVGLCRMRIFSRFHYVWYLVSVTKRRLGHGVGGGASDCVTRLLMVTSSVCV